MTKKIKLISLFFICVLVAAWLAMPLIILAIKTILVVALVGIGFYFLIRALIA